MFSFQAIAKIGVSLGILAAAAMSAQQHTSVAEADQRADTSANAEAEVRMNGATIRTDAAAHTSAEAFLRL